ncbi:MAG: hypothetical protein P8K79_13020 [Mariniblastus sp.]|nr:hypothetical protein [Mariniblastus sp.]
MNRKQIISTGLLCLLLAWPQGPLSRCCPAFGSTADVSGATEGHSCCHQKTGIDPANAGCPQCCCPDPSSKLAIKPTTGSHGLSLAPGSSYSYLRPRAERLSPLRWEPVPQALGHQQRQATLSVWLK